MAQHLPWALLFYAWGGWGFVFWGVCARVTTGVFGHWIIGYFAHNHGGMHHVVDGAAVQGRNVRWTSLLTMGECWHNNHHAFPGSARLGLHPGEWDPGWWALLALRRVGLVWDLRLPEDLAPRPELRDLLKHEPPRVTKRCRFCPVSARQPHEDRRAPEVRERCASNVDCHSAAGGRSGCGALAGLVMRLALLGRAR